MADRSIKVILRAQVDGYTRAMREAADSTERVALEADTAGGRLVEFATKNQQAAQTVGTALTAVGAATTVAMGSAIKAAIDWESAWAGVVKTVDGSPEQLGEIEDGLRELARTLPATHEEIAAVAEAAGQLGVAQEDIVGFTRTMIDLGESTNLTAEEAATSIAQISNVMGTMEREGAEGVERFGAALVELGNNGASTEADILSMAQRIAGAGATVGATEADVLALANTLASMGINAELGGGVATRVLLKMRTAVDEGGESLAAFADVAGTSAEDFAATFRTAPLEALQLVAGGINDVNQAGGNVTQTLGDMGVKGTEETQVMLALANSGDLLTESLETGARAWEENEALAAEAEKRYETTAAKMAIAWNTIKDAAITVGEVALPVLAGLADAVAGVVSAFGALPEPVQQVVGAIAGVAGVASLAAGGFLLLAPRALETYSAFKDLGAVSPRVATGVGKVGRGLGKAAKAAGVAAAAFTAAQLAGAAFGAEVDASSTSEWTKELLDVADAADATAIAFKGVDDVSFADKMFSAAEAYERLTDPTNGQAFQDWSGDILGMATNADMLSAEFETLGQALAVMYDSDPQQATAIFNGLLSETGAEADALKDLMPAYRDALLDADNAQRTTADGAAGIAEGLGTVDPAAEAAAEALEEFYERANGAFESFIDPGGAFQAAIDKNTELAEKTAEATDSAEDSWEDYYDGQSVSSEDYIAQLQKQVDAQTAWRDNMISLSERVNEGMTGEMREAANGMIDELLDLGPEGAAQVQLLKEMSDEELAEVVSLYQRKGESASNEFADEINATRPDPIPVSVQDNASPTIRTIADGLAGLNSRTITVTTRRRTEVFTTNRDVTKDHTPLAAGGLVGLASGGMVPGTPPANPMADNVLAVTQGGTPYAIRSGEFIQSQPAVDFYGTAAMAAINSRRVPKNLLTGFAPGGQVPGYAGGGRPGSSAGAGVTATLAPEDRALLRAVADRPVRLDVDGRKFAEVSRSTQRRFDAR